VVHPVKNLEGFCLGEFALLHVGFKLVEGLGDDREVAVLEEERDDTSLHIRALLSCLCLQVFVNELRLVPHLDKLALHTRCLSSKLISLHDDITLGLRTNTFRLKLCKNDEGNDLH